MHVQTEATHIYEAGKTAREAGHGLELCPYTHGNERGIWQQGWGDADLQLRNGTPKPLQAVSAVPSPSEEFCRIEGYHARDIGWELDQCPYSHDQQPMCRIAWVSGWTMRSAEILKCKMPLTPEPIEPIEGPEDDIKPMWIWIIIAIGALAMLFLLTGCKPRLGNIPTL